MTFETITHIVSAAGIAFLMVIIISVAIYYARIGVHSVITRAEISIVKKGGNNAKGVIKLYNCWNRADAFLRAFQACQIGSFSHSSIRDFLPRRRRINNKTVAINEEGNVDVEMVELNQNSDKLKKLERLIDKIPEEMKEELFRKPQERERDAR